ncbi:MAG: tRNA glutamyl-Q(34) synthetase GluQRS [Pirellula sp.]
MTYIGRLAPSPTGAQHVGNARTYLAAWLLCRQAQGKILLRIEDLDTPRTKIGATEQAIEDLRWLGLDWDQHSSASLFTTQSDRESRYTEVLDELRRLGLVYPCTCTRSEIEGASSAPHESILDGVVYPGACSFRSPIDHRALDEKGIAYAWRFRVPEGARLFWDGKYGEQTLDAKRYLGDFVVARSYGVTAYQLAVVVDDHDYGINHVVRGNDLIYSTYRQMALYESLGWEPPCWLHLPLVVGKDGRRLAKRHGDSRLCHYRKQGVAPERIVGYLGQSLGIQCSQLATPHDLLALIEHDRVWVLRSSMEAIVFDGF